LNRVKRLFRLKVPTLTRMGNPPALACRSTLKETAAPGTIPA
jgi:hypothetical protein